MSTTTFEPKKKLTFAEKVALHEQRLIRESTPEMVYFSRLLTAMRKEEKVKKQKLEKRGI